MALQIDIQYPNAIAADADYPGGSFKNATTPASLDGTPVDKEWGNDLLGLTQKVIQDAGITPNANADTAVLSQVLNGLKFIAGKNLYQNDIDYAIGSISMGSDFILYTCLIVNGPATSVVDPVGDLTSTWEQLLTPDQDLSTEGFKVFPKDANGDRYILEWGQDDTNSAGITKTLPLAMPNEVLAIFALDAGTTTLSCSGNRNAGSPLAQIDLYNESGSLNATFWFVIGK